MKRVKKEYKGRIMTNGHLPQPVNTDNIKEEEIPFYEKKGLDFIFEEYKTIMSFDSKPIIKKKEKSKSNVGL